MSTGLPPSAWRKRRLDIVQQVEACAFKRARSDGAPAPTNTPRAQEAAAALSTRITRRSSHAAVSSTTTEIVPGIPLRGSHSATAGWGLRNIVPKLAELPDDRMLFNESPFEPTNSRSLLTQFDPVRISFPRARYNVSREVFEYTGKLIQHTLAMRDIEGKPKITRFMGPAGDSSLVHGGFARQCGFSGELVAHAENPVVSNMHEQILNAPTKVGQAITAILDDIKLAAENCRVSLLPTFDFSCDEARLTTFQAELEHVFCSRIREFFELSDHPCRTGPFRPDLSDDEKLKCAAYTYLLYEHMGSRFTALAPKGLALHKLAQRMTRKIEGRKDTLHRVFTKKVHCSNVCEMFAHLATHFMGPVREDGSRTLASKMPISSGSCYEKLSSATAGTFAILAGPQRARGRDYYGQFFEAFVPAINETWRGGSRLLVVSADTSEAIQGRFRELGFRILHATQPDGWFNHRGVPLPLMVAVNFDPTLNGAPVLPAPLPRPWSRKALGN